MANKSISQQRFRKYPVGAELTGDNIDFRVWAPGKTKAELILLKPQLATIEMTPEDKGYFRASIKNPGSGVQYKFRLDNHHKLLSDPVSRFQPEGPFGPSEVIDASLFQWHDGAWKGITANKPVIYEMHIGTFTREGTWNAAEKWLAELAKDGISIIELMPIAEFSGRFGWGYDGVNLFAPFRVYGRPDDLRSFVNAAHKENIGVILDIVYNHLGPEGNELGYFCKDYLTDRYICEWGEAINFDSPESGPVREFFLTNARYWIEEYHLDGYRIDATQQIFDSSEPHIIAEITDTARKAAGNKAIYITGENEPQRRILLEPTSSKGCGLDALWNDDFHHSMRTIMTGRNDAYMSDYSGSAQEIVSAAKHGCLYQGQFSRWQKNHRGTNFRGIAGHRFICYIQNHDQIANSAWGYRVTELTSAAKSRAATASLMFGPWTPMIFQGQEFNASTQFLFFADHPQSLAAVVAEGRKEFLKQFPGIATSEMQNALADPSLEATFLRSKLDESERQKNFKFRLMFQRLSQLRILDKVLSSTEFDIDGAVLGRVAFVLRYFSSVGDRLLVVNLGPNLFFSPAPEPLLACCCGRKWEMIFSTEDPMWGGSGTPQVESVEGWRIPAECTMLFSTVDASE